MLDFHVAVKVLWLDGAPYLAHSIIIMIIFVPKALCTMLTGDVVLGGGVLVMFRIHDGLANSPINSISVRLDNSAV